jgi:hypothetical protein
VPRSGRAPRERAPRAAGTSPRSAAVTFGIAGVVILAVVGTTGTAAWKNLIDWQSIVMLAKMAVRSEPAPAAVSAPVALDASLPLPRQGETALLRARALIAGGHLRDALLLLDAVRRTDPQQPEVDRLRADIQRQLLALTRVPAGEAPEKGERPTP